MNKTYTDQVRIVFTNFLQASKTYFELCKLEIYMPEYQYFTVIIVWENYIAKIEVWDRLQPLYFKGCRYIN